MTRDKTPHITISDRNRGLPYSKGLMASQVMVTGLPPHRAYEVAESIEQRLLDGGRSQISSEELSDLTLETIRELAGDRYATTFLRWRDVERLDVPLVILIGGATGVGKSTIATQLAYRLGIVRVVATDGSIREVMRAMLSAELMPALHVSSFMADRAIREPTRRSDALLQGFREQTQAVAVGIQALIERAATDGTSLVIEGAHVVPGFFDADALGDRILPVPIVLEVEDESRHLNHFAARETGLRPADRYAAHFDNIRKIQRYIKSQALSHDVPIVSNHGFDQALSAVIDIVMVRATERATQHAGAQHRSDQRSSGRSA
jgi:2-phosphoglycerate kinase